MLGADTKINLNPIERIIGEHDLDKSRLGARRHASVVVASYSCMWSAAGCRGCGRIRVLAVYMIANNGGKVSNLIVGPHQSIPFTLHHEQGAPLFTGTAPQFGDTLWRIYFNYKEEKSDYTTFPENLIHFTKKEHAQAQRKEWFKHKEERAA